MPVPSAIKLANMNIKTRLSILTGILLLAIAIVGAGGWYVLRETMTGAENAIERAHAYQSAVDTARNAQVDFKKQIQEWKDILLRGREPASYDKYLRNFASQSEATRLDLEDLRSTMKAIGSPTGPIEEALKIHRDLGMQYQEALRHYDPSNPDSAYQVDLSIRGIDRAPTDQIDKIVEGILEESNRSLAEIKKSADERYRTARIFLLTVALAAVLAGLMVTYWLVRSITEPLNTALGIAHAVAGGNLDMEIDVHGEDETAQLLRSLMEMNAALRTSRAAQQDREWQKGSQNDLHSIMRGDRDTSLMADQVLAYYVAQVKAEVGALYLHDEHGVDLVLTASCGLSQSTPGGEIRLSLGDGLVGRAVKEQKVRIVSGLPDDYLAIASALGSAKPTCVAIVPLVHGENVIGVIEVAALHPFAAREMEFIDATKEILAIGFEVSISRHKTQTLLVETEQQAEELRVQQEELQQSNEELEERAEMLSLQREQLRAKNAEIEDATAEITRKAEELERVSTYKSEFLANMSHELRTPLNSMLILSGLLMENKGKNLTEKQVEYASTIQGAGKDLLNLINDILDLSKVEAGQIEFQYEDEVPAMLCDAMRRLFQTPTEQKGLRFSTDVAPDVPSHVHVDVQRTLQILKNLIGNALKFTHEGGITLRIHVPPAQENPLGAPALAYAVSDTGIGVPKDKLALVFEAFKQADGSVSRKYGGTGLGLSISLQLARRMGGDLKMTSEEGRGTTATLYLPLGTVSPALSSAKRAGAEASPPAPATAPPVAQPAAPIPTLAKTAPAADATKANSAGARKILIIEDDHAFANILGDFVQQHGYTPVLAADGSIGIRLAQEAMPCAILLDVMLPKIDGWGVMRHLKESPETRHIPVHFITCLEDRQRAIEMGAIGFITKPVSPEQLSGVFKTIESAIDKSVKKLLIVEDDEREAKSLTGLLADNDVAITVAATGKEAIEHLAMDRFDCMVLDLGLADMSGFDLLAHIQGLDQARQLPIIVHSGRDLTREEERELQHCAQSIIVKGAKSPERLLNEVTLFLHMVESRMEPAKRDMIRAAIDGDFELGGKKVLIVDDDMRNIFSLTSLLSDKGIVVVEAENGKEALAQLEKHDDICLVLMDVMMPEMDGFEAMRHIRKEAKWADLPIIAMTAKVMKGDSEKCLEAGASDYIGKPIEPRKLTSMLHVWAGAGA